jgi:hypothetical protein
VSRDPSSGGRIGGVMEGGGQAQSGQALHAEWVGQYQVFSVVQPPQLAWVPAPARWAREVRVLIDSLLRVSLRVVFFMVLLLV